MPDAEFQYRVSPQFSHRIFFTEDALDPANPTLANAIFGDEESPEPLRVFACFDEGLLSHHPDLPVQLTSTLGTMERSGRKVELVAEPTPLPGGEACKNDWALVEQLWTALNAYPLSRHSRVLVIGGGAVLDLVGFAVATAHRGLRLVRMPTTTLAQGDSGVGVKCGVNRFGQKNWVGALAPPWAVVNDLTFLDTQPERERRAGLAEALKVALVRSPELFEYLEENTAALNALQRQAVHHAVIEGGRIHADHIANGGDPFEQGESRPLDFGHWSAHKLEQLSGFELSHGEAVAVGMVIDLHYAHRIGLLAESDLRRILDVASRMGLLTALESPSVIRELSSASQSSDAPLLRGFEEFRLHLGGQLCLCMVTGPGQSSDVNVVDHDALQQALCDTLTLAQQTVAH